VLNHQSLHFLGALSEALNGFTEHEGSSESMQCWCICCCLCIALGLIQNC